MFDLGLLAKGGIVMGILVALSVYATAIIFYKFYQFFSANVFNTAFIDGVMQPIKRGELSEVAPMLAREKGPIARIMRVAVECVMNRDMTIKSRESEIARVGSSELRQLESQMRGLEMVATTAPLLGLLGTVIGMIRAFSKLGEAGTRVDPSMLAGGIWEALLTTVGGLAVAIPAVAMYYLLDSIIERVRAQMRDVTVQILALEDMFLRNEKEQERAEARRERELEKQSQRELWQKEQELRQQIEEQEKAVEAMRSTPQSTGTLKLLSPSYGKK